MADHIEHSRKIYLTMVNRPPDLEVCLALVQDIYLFNVCPSALAGNLVIGTKAIELGAIRLNVGTHKIHKYTVHHFLQKLMRNVNYIEESFPLLQVKLYLRHQQPPHVIA